MQNQLLENLFAYKKTAALLAAFQLRLFRQIKDRGCLNKETLRQLGWSERYVELLCTYLADEGYLAEVNGSWQPSKDFESQLGAFEKICEHENSLYHKWLSPELIVSSVQSAANSRPFDKEGFAPEEQSAYDNTMYGDNVNSIAFHLLRKIKREKASSVRCMEYGRSDGRIGQALKKHLPKMSLDVVSLNQSIEEQASYDVILIYNTIHYRTTEEWEPLFSQMKNSLNEDGFICIADVFYKVNNVFQSTVLLDWITHGGVYGIYKHEVAEQLLSIGFMKVEQQFIDSISIDLIYACQ
jgi:hypothetical protein